ncbi:MAG: polysaccharide pyruvyl transferase family protein [Candidatus Omnitrophica bacterium]|nr:polysaccharide pyruvyl transferase family protein [Candidatus Omnitrophota bacterium]
MLTLSFLSKRFAINFLSTALQFAVNMGISIWFTAYLVRRLDIAGFGLIPLAVAVSSYLTLLSYSLNNVVSRFLTISLEKNGRGDEARRIFSTGFIGTLLGVAFLILPGIWITFHSGQIFRIPDGYDTQAQWLFAFAALASLVTAIAIFFGVVSYCRNRFDLRNIVNVGSNVVRIGLVVLLFSWNGPDVWKVGAGALAAALVTLGANFWIWRCLEPSLGVSTKLFSWPELKNMAGTSTWILVNDIGTLLLISIDLILANRLLGPTAGGLYAAAIQGSIILRNFSMLVVDTFGPTTFAFYAKNDISGLVDYAKKSVKLVGLLMALPVSLICGFSYPILEVWLGHGFGDLALLMSLLTFHLCFNLGYMSLHKIVLATNRVQVPALVQIGFGIANIFLAVFLVEGAHWGVYGIAAASALVLAAKNSFFTPAYVAHLLKRPYGTFMKELFPTVRVTAILTAASWLVSRVFQPASWHELALSAGMISLAYIFLIRKQVEDIFPFATQVSKDVQFLARNFSSNGIARGYYVGFSGENLGDEALRHSIFSLFDSRVLFSHSRGAAVRFMEKQGLLRWNMLMLGGGTLLLRSQNVLDSISVKGIQKRVVFGTGAANPAFWKDVSANYGAREDWLRFLNSCEYIGVRGPISKKILEEIGVKKEVRLIGDPALYFTREIRTPLTPALANGHTRKLGVNVGTTHDGDRRSLLWGGDEEKFLRRFAHFLTLMSQDGWEIELIPVWQKDMEAIRRVISDSGLGNRIRVFKDFHSVRKTIDKMETFDVFIGQKLHSVILACCANRPSIMVEYRPKCRDFMASMDLESWTVRTDEFAPAGVKAMVEALYGQKIYYTRKIHEMASYYQNKLFRESQKLMEAVL